MYREVKRDMNFQHYIFKDDYDINAVLEEFRRIGRDSEYSPEPDGETFKFATEGVSHGVKDHPGNIEASWLSVVQNIPPRRKATQMSRNNNRMICGFCRNNGETPLFYQSHRLKDEQNKVSCPVLRKYVCPICNASGDNAHTLRYCPYNTFPKHIALVKTLKSMRNSIGSKGPLVYNH